MLTENPSRYQAWIPWVWGIGITAVGYLFIIGPKVWSLQWLLATVLLIPGAVSSFFVAVMLGGGVMHNPAMHILTPISNILFYTGLAYLVQRLRLMSREQSQV